MVSYTFPPLEITRLLPVPLDPTRRAALLLQRELVPVTRTLLFEELVALPIVPAVSYTFPPLEITRPLPEPLDPTRRAPLLLQRELVPVTTTELFEEVVALPIVPAVSYTFPPLEITRPLPEPLDPTRRAPLLLQRELVPVTTTELFEEVVALPIVPAVSYTFPPSEITRLLLEPLDPTRRAALLLQSELAPVTTTELFEEVVALPIVPAVPVTLPPLEITRETPLFE